MVVEDGIIVAILTSPIPPLLILFNQLIRATRLAILVEIPLNIPHSQLTATLW